MSKAIVATVLHLVNLVVFINFIFYSLIEVSVNEQQISDCSFLLSNYTVLEIMPANLFLENCELCTPSICCN